MCGCVWPFLQIVKYLQRKITKDKHLNNLLSLVREQSRNMRQSLASVILISPFIPCRVLPQRGRQSHWWRLLLLLLLIYLAKSLWSAVVGSPWFVEQLSAELAEVEACLKVNHWIYQGIFWIWSWGSREFIRFFVDILFDIISLLMSIPLNSLDDNCLTIGNCPISCIVLFFSLPFSNTLCARTF